MSQADSYVEILAEVESVEKGQMDAPLTSANAALVLLLEYVRRVEIKCARGSAVFAAKF